MILKAFEINKINNIKKKYFLFYGENEGFKNQVIKEKFEVNFANEIYRYDEKDLLDNENLFFENILNKSFFETKKLIIISRASDKILKIIKEIIEKGIDDIILIISSKILEKKSKLRNYFEKENDLICIAFYEDNKMTLSQIVSSFFKEKKISLSQENINLLVDRCRGDRENLSNELKKIEIFISGKTRISSEEIIKITNLSNNYSINELVDNCLSKNLKKTSHIINENVFSSDDCIIILRTMLNKSKRLQRISNNLDKNKSVEVVISQFKPPIFWKEKETVINQIKKRNIENINHLINEINETELLVKKNFDNCLNITKNFLISQTL